MGNPLGTYVPNIVESAKSSCGPDRKSRLFGNHGRSNCVNAIHWPDHGVLNMVEINRNLHQVSVIYLYNYQLEIHRNNQIWKQSNERFVTAVSVEIRQRRSQRYPTKLRERIRLYSITLVQARTREQRHMYTNETHWFPKTQTQSRIINSLLHKQFFCHLLSHTGNDWCLAFRLSPLDNRLRLSQYGRKNIISIQYQISRFSFHQLPRNLWNL